jgi:hypothetical protein
LSHVDDITNVRQLRESYGWSRRKTALLVGLSEGGLRKVEAGTRRLSGRRGCATSTPSILMRFRSELSPS